MVLIFGILFALKILSSYIVVEKESTLNTAEWDLLKVDTPKDQKRARKPKRLFYDEDEDSTPTGDTNCEIPRKVIVQLYNALGGGTGLQLDATKDSTTIYTGYCLLRICLQCISV